MGKFLAGKDLVSSGQGINLGEMPGHGETCKQTLAWHACRDLHANIVLGGFLNTTRSLYLASWLSAL